MNCNELSKCEICEILENNSLASISVVTPNNNPYVIPILYGYDNDCGDSIFYFVVNNTNSLLLDSINQNNNVAILVQEHFACSSRIYGDQINFSSVIAYGTASYVNDCCDKQKIIQFISNTSSENQRFLSKYINTSDAIVIKVCVNRITSKRYVF